MHKHVILIKSAIHIKIKGIINSASKAEKAVSSWMMNSHLPGRQEKQEKLHGVLKILGSILSLMSKEGRENDWKWSLIHLEIYSNVKTLHSFKLKWLK